MSTLADRLDALLPQTQCTRCGYADCRAYADAIANEGAAINRCPPGGDTTLAALAAATGQPPSALDPECGSPGPLRLAVIDEARCIGCTLCIRACPVDAIVGGGKRMHAVLASLCSGCKLCLPPCPVDCIAMVDAGRAWSVADGDAARERHRARDARLARHEPVARRRAARPTTLTSEPVRSAAVAAALARARARRATRGGQQTG
ncbi:MAG: RnfABCDGE type electron transport complex subunit B [Proteobacteria bacterium]|nr:RnfABCDGE type electron transport complex subunit B [Pseudomonadota bacterium]